MLGARGEGLKGRGRLMVQPYMELRRRQLGIGEDEGQRQGSCVPQHATTWRHECCPACMFPESVKPVGELLGGTNAFIRKLRYRCHRHLDAFELLC